MRDKFCFTFRYKFADVSDLILLGPFEDFTKHNEHAAPKLQRYLQTLLKLSMFSKLNKNVYDPYIT